jgi:hypothetical protein
MSPIGAGFSDVALSKVESVSDSATPKAYVQKKGEDAWQTRLGAFYFLRAAAWIWSHGTDLSHRQVGHTGNWLHLVVGVIENSN